MPSFLIPNFLGGVNESVDYSLIKLNQASAALNCEITDGTLKDGLGAIALYTASVGFQVKALMTYYTAGVGYIFAVDQNGKLYKWNGSAMVEITAASGCNPLTATSFAYDYVNDNVNNTDILIFTNGVDTVKIYEGGTTYRDLRKLGKASLQTDTTNRMSGKYMTMHNERVWIADDNFLYASTSNRNGFDVEDFTTPTDEVEVNQHGTSIFLYSNDGSRITGMETVFDDIIIWKEKQIYKIFGYDPNSFQKIQFSAKGGIADKSIAVNESGAFFIDLNGIYYYDGTNVKLISDPIKKTWSGLNQSYLKYSVARMWGNKYVLAVPNGASTVNNLIIEYDIVNKNFMFKSGINVYTMASMSNQLMFAQSTNIIYQYGTATDMAGTPKNCYWTTSYSDWGFPEASKELEMLYFTGIGNGQVTITITTERGSKSKTVTLTSTESVYPLNFAHRGRLVQIKIQNVNGSFFTIKGFKILYELDPD